MKNLQRILCRPVKDTPRNREYQAYIDANLAHRLAGFDLERGLAHTKGMAALPDEADPAFVGRPLEERRKRLDDVAAGALAQSATRGTTAVLATAAWCYRIPWSTYYRDASMVDLVKNGLESFMKRQREDGVWVFGLREDGGFGMGWTVEGMIMAVAWLEEELGEDLVARCMAMFRKAVGSFKGDAGFHPVSNQQSVWCFNMMLFGLLFDEPEYVDAAKAQWELCRFVFGRDGQIIEQGGPCANYSRTTFIYAFLYLVLAEDRSMDAQVVEACKWFRRMHTRSMHPFEGMSSRSSHFLTHGMVDTLAAMERFAPEEPIFARFIDEYIEQEKRDKGGVGAIGHGASPLVWAMLEHRGEVTPSEEDIARWNEPFDRMYWTWDIQYLLVHRRYQTAVTFRGRSALMGLQTWAWEDEPPVLHPSHEAASTTLAMGIDTATFGVSHNRPDRGAGLKAEEVVYIPGDWSEHNLQYEPVGVDRGMAMPALDRYFRWTQTHHHPGGFEQYMTEGDPAMVVTRWGRLWCWYIFTPASTLVLQNGEVGRRITRWAFNPVCVPAPTAVEDGVAFAGREGRLFALDAPPRLDVIADVPVAEFDIAPDRTAAFAFSNGAFAFEAHDADTCTLTFRDAAGRYRADYANVVDERGHVNWDRGAFINKL